MGSEPGVGWNWLQQLRLEHEVWLLTRDTNRLAIERAITPDVHVVYVPISPIYFSVAQSPLGLHWLLYYWWQWKAYRVASRLHEQVRFDVAHHVTFVSWRAPSFLCLLPIPFIWGPVGGGGTPPRSLAGELGWRGRLSEGYRSICQRLPRFDPGVRLTLWRAAVVFANLPETANLIPSRWQQKVRLLFGIGMQLSDLEREDDAPDQLQDPRNKAIEPSKGLTVLFSAQLRPLKGGSLALRAFAELSRTHPDCRLVILGDGPEYSRLTALAHQLGVTDRVQFRGWLQRSEALRCMRKADVLLHPSLRDSGGMVLLEAMAHKKPVVCLDLGGPGHIVTPDCGFKVHPGIPDQVVADLAAALRKLAEDPELRRSLGESGRRRVQEQFDWKSRGRNMAEFYRELVKTKTRTEAVA